MSLATLYYVHDPMCSWCWGYRPVWLKLKEELAPEVRVENVVGGLAPDNEAPMPAELQATIQGHWRRIEGLLGTEFNHAFWEENQPRRDTYKACRAVVVAAGMGLEEAMIEAIQRAYYLRAMNPSEPAVLVQLAGELGLDEEAFRKKLLAGDTEREFQRQLDLARRLGARSFPSLILESGTLVAGIPHDYQDYLPAVQAIQALIRKTAAG